MANMNHADQSIFTFKYNDAKQVFVYRYCDTSCVHCHRWLEVSHSLSEKAKLGLDDWLSLGGLVWSPDHFKEHLQS